VAATLVVAAAGGLRDPHAQTAQADVALVLAVDVSGSVDDIRFKLQGEATAAALESDELAALSADVNRMIEVAVVEGGRAACGRALDVIRGRSELWAVATGCAAPSGRGSIRKPIPRAALPRRTSSSPWSRCLPPGSSMFSGDGDRTAARRRPRQAAMPQSSMAQQ
jgi:hypothetical protein